MNPDDKIRLLGFAILCLCVSITVLGIRVHRMEARLQRFQPKTTNNTTPVGVRLDTTLED